ncbi:MAG: hypothetical protein K6F00_08220, partial [Lachnospiraceae bacterium]|nr:hypothetical protein [Lachnospiraceae bacterium]
MKNNKHTLIILFFVIMTAALFSACSFLPKTKTTVSVVGEGYKVILPDSYDKKTTQVYPVVYVLPDNG